MEIFLPYTLQTRRTRSIRLSHTSPEKNGIGNGNRSRRWIGRVAVKKIGEFFLYEQTGSLLVNYLLIRWKELGKIKGKEFVAKTIVTTGLIIKCKSSRVKVYNTLTGFKHRFYYKRVRGKRPCWRKSYGYLNRTLFEIKML